MPKFLSRALLLVPLLALGACYYPAPAPYSPYPAYGYAPGYAPEYSYYPGYSYYAPPAVSLNFGYGNGWHRRWR